MKTFKIDNAEITLRDSWDELTVGERLNLFEKFETIGTGMEYKKFLIMILISPFHEKITTQNELKYSLKRLTRVKLSSATDLVFWIAENMEKEESFPVDRFTIMNEIVSPFLWLNSLKENFLDLMIPPEERRKILTL